MRLIDADELSGRMYHEVFDGLNDDLTKWDSGCWIRYKLFEQVLNGTPTVEAEPIYHAEWLMDEESGDLQCSRCGHWSFDMYDEHMVIDGKIGVAAINPHYCGYCGAKMDDAEVQI